MDKSKQLLSSYLDEQLALESNLLSVVETQLKDANLNSLPKAFACLLDIKSTLERHVLSLKALGISDFEKAPDGISVSISETVADVTGSILSLYNKFRDEKVSRLLRDNFAVLSLATLTYSMIFTAAKGLGETKTAAVAASNMRDFPQLVMRLNTIIPGIMIAELHELGFSVDDEAKFEAVIDSRAAWNQPEQIKF